MIIKINGINVEKNSCTTAPLQFGKSVKNLPNEIVCNYIIVIDIQYFIAKFENIFNDFVNDYRIDDELYPGQEDNLSLREKGYPKLQDLINNDRVFLAQFIIDNLGLELMDCLLGKASTTLKYVICNITDLEITDCNVFIKGDCIKHYIKQ